MANQQQTVRLTPDQLQTVQSLTAILMPFASEKMSKARQIGARFVHYTSAAGGLGIINSKQIWMRNVTTMSDYSEVQHGYRMINEHPNTQVLLNTLNRVVRGSGDEAVALFQRWWQNIQLGTFSTSISEHRDTEDQHGRLSMWRAFGGGAARVALVLKIPLEPGIAQGVGLSMSPVSYYSTDQLGAELASVAKNIETNAAYLRETGRQMVVASAFATLMMRVICLKHEGFHEEVEWRITYSPTLTASPLMESVVEIIGGIPQKVFKIPLGGGNGPLQHIAFPKLLDRVIVGPSSYPWAQYEAYVDALQRAGVADAGERVFVSGLPIRV